MCHCPIFGDLAYNCEVEKCSEADIHGIYHLNRFRLTLPNQNSQTNLPNPNFQNQTGLGRAGGRWEPERLEAERKTKINPSPTIQAQVLTSFLLCVIVIHVLGNKMCEPVGGFQPKRPESCKVPPADDGGKKKLYKVHEGLKERL